MFVVSIRSIKSLRNLRGKKVIVRNDFNVPIKNGRVADDFKIVKQLPTIRYLLKKKAKIMLFSHLGRPKTKEDRETMSLQAVKRRLERYLDTKVKFINSINTFESETALAKLEEGKILLFENVRFYKEETEPNLGFAKKIARLGDVFVSDAFGVSHREQATVSIIQNYIDSYAGLLTEQEIKNLEKAKRPQKPAVALFGGVKLPTKMPLLKLYLKRADYLLLGGGLANNFLAAYGYEVGKSLVEKEGISLAKKIKSDKLVIPIDVVLSSNKNGGQARVKKIADVSKQDYIFDIGPDTVKLYSTLIKSANSLVWNGPMGFFELNDYRHGTMAIARLVAARSKGKAFGVVGGGETVEALKKTKMIEYVDWVSTGGGAMLTYLGGGKMPGLKNIVK